MDQDIRPGEVAVALPPATDAGLVFIGVIRTPWTERRDCPRQGRVDGPVCRLELRPPFDQGLDGLAAFEMVEVLYWLHASRRDLVRQSPRSRSPTSRSPGSRAPGGRSPGSDGATRGVFALRSPVRPNPIGVSRAALVGIEDGCVLVRGLDCLDGTPLVDLKPERCAYAQPDYSQTSTRR